ncbi:hypothetical protein BDZ91DRAFT_844110 [Kalaharituber pfeilii]|nr:hypothetical protein BDZ91DRAFT_844110 [Kalaharituber pfeilii]
MFASIHLVAIFKSIRSSLLIFSKKLRVGNCDISVFAAYTEQSGRVNHVENERQYSYDQRREQQKDSITRFMVIVAMNLHR